jgi:hypothetical protein
MILAEGTARELKERKGLCIVVGCGNYAEKDKRRKKRNLLCGKHRYEQQVNRSPIKCAYRHLKSGAKRRGKLFTITYEYFEQWCKETNYIELKGRKAGYYTVDRINDTRGYEPGNLQIMEHNMNIKKQYIDKWLMQKYGSGGGFTTRQEAYDECDWNNFEWINGEPVPKSKQDDLKAPF